MTRARRRTAVRALAVGLVATAVLAPDAAARVADPAVTVTTLFPGEPGQDRAGDVNRHGVIVGTRGSATAFLWDDGRTAGLTPPGEAPVELARLNDRGDVVLRTTAGTQLWQAGRWRSLGTQYPVSLDRRGRVLSNGRLDDPDFRFTYLWDGRRTRALRPPALTADFWVLGQDLNDAGQVLVEARSTTAGVPPRFFVWTADRYRELLPTAPGGNLDARVMNDRGDVVGVSAPSLEETAAMRATIWRKGRPTVLAQLPGATYSEAGAVNDRGEVAGVTTLADGSNLVTLWRRGRVTVLPHPAGTFGTPGTLFVNDRGQVAGTVSMTGPAFDPARAVTWWRGRVVDLGPGVVSAMNENGVMVGHVADPLSFYDVSATRWTVDWNGAPRPPG
jgi:uncharacterized membrane protein